MRTISKTVLSVSFLISLSAAAAPAFAAGTVTHKHHAFNERQLPAEAQPAALMTGTNPSPFAPTHEDPAKDAHWGPAHNVSPALW
ncbi:hypothetical protein V5F77_21695 [Xanthobacter sp. DSM 24535]|uniref:hypothetical protein n=1 Tax=Roseixanthobacter psychrophilus TaxID=3119917 RepID=UPI00372A001D